MPLVHVNGVASTASNTTSFSVTMPTFLAGDIVYVYLFTGNTPTAPAGWTLLSNASDQIGNTYYLYSRVMASGDPSSYIWSFVNSSDAIALADSFRNQAASSPTGTITHTLVSSPSTSATSSLVTPSVANTIVLAYFGAGSTSATSAALSGSWTTANSAFLSSGRYGSVLGILNVGSPSAVDATATFNNVFFNCLTATFALSPEATPATGIPAVGWLGLAIGVGFPQIGA